MSPNASFSILIAILVVEKALVVALKLIDFAASIRKVNERKPVEKKDGCAVLC
jgi:hypothetical protein